MYPPESRLLSEDSNSMISVSSLVGRILLSVFSSVITILSGVPFRYINYEALCFFSIRFNEFDHRFFGISEAEANFMDPQQKLLLQCSYRALENSGIPMEKISGSRTGVYIGNDNSISVYFKIMSIKKALCVAHQWHWHDTNVLYKLQKQNICFVYFDYAFFQGS